MDDHFIGPRQEHEEKLKSPICHTNKTPKGPDPTQG